MICQPPPSGEAHDCTRMRSRVGVGKHLSAGLGIMVRVRHPHRFPIGYASAQLPPHKEEADTNPHSLARNSNGGT